MNKKIISGLSKIYCCQCKHAKEVSREIWKRNPAFRHRVFYCKLKKIYVASFITCKHAEAKPVKK